MAEEEKSIRWVVTMLMLAIALAGWCFAAAFYFQSGSDEGGNETHFFVNAIIQIPNAASVISFTFRERFWLVIVVLVLEALALGFGAIAKKVEKDLEGGSKGKRPSASKR